MDSVIEFVVGNLEAAGVIGGYVAISIVGVAIATLLIRRRFANRMFSAPRWTHPIIGAFLGVIPGCGATIVVSSLYKKSKISFGGLFATFIATLGEGSFVLLGASDEADVEQNLRAFVIVNIVGFITGSIAGLVIDAAKVRRDTPKTTEIEGDPLAEVDTDEGARANPLARLFIEKVGFIPLITMAAFLFPGSIMALWGGGIGSIEELTVWVAIAFATGCIVHHLIHRFGFDPACCHNTTTVYGTLVEAVVDIALVVFYVFIGLMAANYVIDILVGPERFDAWMTSSAVLVVIISALIGAIPGCGGMIAVAAACVTIPNFPMAGLIAAAIATSGDGSFPLIAANKRDAIVVTATGLLLAIIVGYIALLLGL